jgi:hypothetical protein
MVSHDNVVIALVIVEAIIVILARLTLQFYYTWVTNEVYSFEI